MPERISELIDKQDAGHIRTVLGDIPTHGLGTCNAHDHIIITGTFTANRFPDFLLDSIDAACIDVAEFRDARGGWIVDTMPTGAGRDAIKLREVAQRIDIPIVCPTGVHLAKYYPPNHFILKMDRDALTELFIDEITTGVDDGQGATGICAGVIKVAGGENGLDTFQQETFIAAAQAQAQTGCPIITHCEKGTAGLEQVALLENHGADLTHVVLSHCDKINDPSYHRDLLNTGVRLEYDQHFRQVLRGEPCVTAKLIAELAPDYPNQIVVGMDIARRRNWHGHGGEPGLVWLVTHLPKLLAEAEVDAVTMNQVMIYNARTAFSIKPL